MQASDPAAYTDEGSRPWMPPPPRMPHTLISPHAPPGPPLNSVHSSPPFELYALFSPYASPLFSSDASPLPHFCLTPASPPSCPPPGPPPFLFPDVHTHAHTHMHPPLPPCRSPQRSKSCAGRGSSRSTPLAGSSRTWMMGPSASEWTSEGQVEQPWHVSLLLTCLGDCCRRSR